MKQEKTIRVHMRVEPALKEAVVEFCRITGMSESEAWRRAIMSFMRGNKASKKAV